MTGTRVYPWDQLTYPGASFLWPIKDDEKSLRAQASKQGKRRSIEITVRLEEGGIRVTYLRGIL